MKKRKILSFIVAMLMVMSTCMTAMATDSSTDNLTTLTTDTISGVDNTVTNTETVTITGIPTDTTVSFTNTYQVLYATYDSTHNEFEYHLTQWALDALVNYTDTALYTNEDDAIAAIQSLTDSSSSLITGSGTTEQNTIVNALAAYVALGSTVSPTYTAASPYASASWNYSTGNSEANVSLPVGAYLVLPSASDMSFLNMLVSVDATAGTNTNTWKTTGHGAVLKGTQNTIYKHVEEGQTATSGVSTTSVDAQIGEYVTYTVTVDVPQFATGIANTDITFEVVDTPQNVAIDVSTVQVYGNVTGGSSTLLSEYSNPGNTDGAYTAVVDADGKLTVDLDVNYQNTFNSSDNGTTYGTYPYASVTITYTAKVLDSAYVATANTNTAQLEYGTYTITNTKTAQANVNTYQVVLTKNDGNTTVLPGTEFRIATGDPSTAIQFVHDLNTTGTYTVYDGTGYDSATEELVYDLVTGTDGTITIIGLDSSTNYTITETKAPSGYSKNNNYYVFSFTESSVSAGVIDTATGTECTNASDPTSTAVTPSAWSTPSVDGTNTYQLNLQLANTTIIGMPSTGGVGIIVFTVIGVILMVAAVFLLNSKDTKKKQVQ